MVKIADAKLYAFHDVCKVVIGWFSKHAILNDKESSIFSYPFEGSCLKR